MYLNIAIGLVGLTFVVLSTIYYDFFGLGDEAFYLAMGLLGLGIAVAVLFHFVVLFFKIRFVFGDRSRTGESVPPDQQQKSIVQDQISGAGSQGEGYGPWFVYVCMGVAIGIMMLVLSAIQ